jgi:hypothetical protein
MVDNDSIPARDNARGPGWLGAALAVVLCLSCFGGLLAFGAGARGQLSGGYTVEVCVGVNTAPRWQVGVTWIAPFMSSLPPVTLQNRACAVVPWLPSLPPRGGFALP